MWNEDWHHAAFVALTGRREAYFTDYQGTAPEFASMARHGPLYQGQWYTWQTTAAAAGSRWDLRPRPLRQLSGEPRSGRQHRTGRAPVSRASIVARWRAFTALLLLGPALPMLFQGQEFGSSQPFHVFRRSPGRPG